MTSRGTSIAGASATDSSCCFCLACAAALSSEGPASFSSTGAVGLVLCLRLRFSAASSLMLTDLRGGLPDSVVKLGSKAASLRRFLEVVRWGLGVGWSSLSVSPPLSESTSTLAGTTSGLRVRAVLVGGIVVVKGRTTVARLRARRVPRDHSTRDPRAQYFASISPLILLLSLTKHFRESKGGNNIWWRACFDSAHTLPRTALEASESPSSHCYRHRLFRIRCVHS